jgi:hypothetical protein
MSIRLTVSAGVLAACVSLAVSGEARAQANVLKECGSRYQQAKAANELAGKSWQDFLKQCRVDISESKPAAPAEAPKTAPAAEAPAPAPAAEAPKPAPAPAPAAEAPKPAAPKAAAPAKETKSAVNARQKACGAEWKAQKAELKKKDPKISWPKFWSECNARLKAEGK